jgi:hypothetical protein
LRDAGTLFHHIPLSLTNPIASTLRAHVTRQDESLLASLRDRATHITDPHTYKQTHCDFTPRRTRTSLLPRLTPLWHNDITTWPQVLLRASCFYLAQIMQIHRLTRRSRGFALRPYPSPSRGPPRTPRDHSQPSAHHTSHR